MNEVTESRAPAARARRGWRRARAAGRWLLGLLVLLALGLFALNRHFSVHHYTGPSTDHFVDGRFVNQVPLPAHGLGEFLRWRRERKASSWAGYSPAPPTPAVPDARVLAGDLRVTFVGHASVLIQTAGLNILTDPIWSERASPVSWAGPRRHVAPGVSFEALPPIDAVLISHNHYDHLDLRTLRDLAAAHAPAVFLPLGNTALLEQHDIPGGRDLDWWQTVPLSADVSLTCVPARHFSGRALDDRMATLWAGFVLETPGGAVYFAGDTGFGPHFEQLRERFGPPRLALLPIGAYLPSWFMRPVHVDPREAVEAHLVLGAGTSVGIHFGCFELADDGPLQPVEDLRVAREALGLDATRFRTLAAGEVLDVPRR